MKLLAIDTSTTKASIALTDGQSFFEESIDSVSQHAKIILPMVEKLCSQASLRLAQLDGIVFGQGPGSFTGLRIACATVKALAYAHDLPVYPISSLAAIAYEAYEHYLSEQNSQILAVIDARMQQLYWEIFTSNFTSTEAHVCEPEAIQLDTNAPIILAGVGFEPYLERLPATIQTSITHQHVIYPRAAMMIKLVQDGWGQPSSATDALPVYTRNKITYGDSNG